MLTCKIFICKNVTMSMENILKADFARNNLYPLTKYVIHISRTYSEFREAALAQCLTFVICEMCLLFYAKFYEK